MIYLTQENSIKPKEYVYVYCIRDRLGIIVYFGF